MKLYYSPGACSLSPHIVLREGSFDFKLERVDLQSKQTETGSDYKTINPLGCVPALQLDDGQVLTEGPAIVQYLADRVPEKRLAPSAGTLEHYRLMEWLNFISTELHKGFGALFNSALSDDAKAVINSSLEQRIAHAEKRLGVGPYVMGNDFSVADAYLFTVLGWAKYVNVDLAPWPGLLDYLSRVAPRPAVQAALAAEGLIPASK
ncbi:MULTISPECIES: glutathione transferase GstA [Pseudomonas]|jgi:glutathione S-transferase|uniref:Glutathione transferase GstA n=6 Tax=Pseudomonas TaxID=286 RepID=Q847I7_PSEPU|nr:MULTISPECIES: glutathione transferase GstA [Pseudomonas]ART35404.1 A227 [uncultured bacterium]HBN9861308.1 glutathione transferase GstA [Pseudomonas aeruginosa]AAO64285.1 putative gluthione S-transferase [Pseudomonas putida]AAP44197.1 glutathione-S-transferase-like protein [Pseudomonas putida ND6]ACQ63502.1 putative glutathione S-transferase [Pseudomonas fluorescens]